VSNKVNEPAFPGWFFFLCINKNYKSVFVSLSSKTTAMIRFLFLFCAAAIISCSSKEHKFDTATYEKAKESIEEKEKKNPEQFLSVISSDRKNWLGKRVVTGTVRSRATVCSYSGIRLKISFVDKAGTVLKENEESISGTIEPHDSKTFKFRHSAPKETDDIRVTIIDAKAENN
jgi:hypothetical protein